ncbi:Head domain of trimeric autotransporter adhesin [Dyella sp. OK004]|uniref:ESPR-type extended signal peptide-containing protein n=1 Tax=Dyella sp. OK004 TaxID=1855292 RepID=UPI0008F17455|nr:ESPR-type extended signal peptide-containing protein [Dyella sp. OK004]SFS08364.1 Head domain of trimeric autotransporter adhesin [Dyella sp. OK004]
MNIIYRIVWNTATNQWAVASEMAKGRRKATRSMSALCVSAFTLLISSAMMLPSAAMAADSTATTSCTKPDLIDPNVCLDNKAYSVFATAPSYDAGGGVASGEPGNIAIGAGATSSAALSSNTFSSVAIGQRASASANSAVAYGVDTVASGSGAVAVGGAARGTGRNGIAVGLRANAAGQDAVSLGVDSVAGGLNAVALGSATNIAATVSNGTAVGYGASVTANNSVALGTRSVADRINSVAVGAFGAERQIIHVASGTANTDAVNVGQIRSVVDSLGGTFDPATGSITGPTLMVQGATETTLAGAVSALDTAVTNNATNITNLTSDLNNGTVGLVQQSAAGADITVAAGKDGTSVDFAGSGGARTLKSVADGAINANSTEAVNGSQLFTTNQNVTSNTNAITALDGRVTANTTNITALQGQIGNVSASGVQYDDATVKTQVTLGGIGAATGVTLTNVADGALNATSADAVNGSQLFNTNQNVQVLDDRMAVAEGDITNIKSVIGDLQAGGTTNGIAYDDASRDVVTFGGVAGTLLTNIADGRIASGSRDAVNGGQLSDIRDQLQNQIGDLSGRVDGIENGIADGSIGDGGSGGGPITDNGGAPISNVGAGTADSDAANVGQVNTQVNEAIQTANNYTDSKFTALSETLDNFKGEVNQRFQQQDVKINRVGAMSAAMSQMSFSTQGIDSPNRLGVGVGTQGGKSAIAVGYSRSVAPNVSLSFGGSASGSETSGGAGLGIGW